MKRCLAVLLAMLMVLMPATSVFAGSASALNISIGTVYAQTGEKVEVTLDITENPGFCYLGLYLVYDTEALELISVETVDGLAHEGDLQQIWHTTNGENYTETGVMATLTFEVKEGADCEIEISALEGWIDCYTYVVEEGVVVDEAPLVCEIAAGTIHAGEITVHSVASCEEDGAETFFCETCETEIYTEYPAYGHNVINVEAVAPGCHYNGNNEYWYCSNCEIVWADEACTQITNFKNVIIPATGEGDLVHMDAVEPGCHYEGNIEYWICYDCEQVWQDEALTQLTNIKNVVLPAVGGEVVHMDAVAPGCHYDGNIEYWVCYECEKVWIDEALTQLSNIKNVVLPATGEGNVVHVEAVEPGCHYEGNIEYWICYDCEQVWQDEALTQLTNIKNVILPAIGGEVVHIDAVAPGCHYDGNIEYWVCYECEKVWQDEALTQLTNIKNVVIPATGEGEVLHFDAVAPGCHYEGNVEYWFCKDCEKVWTDADLTKLSNLKNVVLPELGGDVIHVAAKAPTATEDGNVEYWYCEKCEQVWIDEALTQISNIKSVVIPATGMVFGDVNGDGKCDGKDYMMLKRHILGTLDYDKVGISEEDIIARGDINGDGKTEAKDFMMLKRYVLGTWTPEEK